MISTCMVKAAAAILMLSLIGCSDPAQHEAKYIQHGITLFNAGEYEKARLEFKNAVRIRPIDAEARYRLGLVDEAENLSQNAFDNYSHAAQQDPHHRGAVLKLAQYNLAADHLDASARYTDTLLIDDPNDADAHAVKAAILLRQQAFPESEQEARRALAIAPDNTTAASVLTGLYLAEGNAARAIEALNASIAQNPRDVALLKLAVAVYKKLNNTEGITESYHHIFKLQPAEPGYRAELAAFLVAAGNVDAAEAELRGGVAAASANLTMKRQLVVFLSDHRGLAPAVAEVSAYVKADPHNRDFGFWLADIYTRHNDTAQAVSVLQAIADRDGFSPTGINARLSLAQIDLQAGRAPEAETRIKAVLAEKPSNHDGLFLQASMEFDRGHDQTVVTNLRQILSEQKNDLRVYPLLAEALARQGRIDLSIDTLRQALDYAPQNGVVRVRLAQMEHVNGDDAQAMLNLDLVTKATPKYAVGWESTARIAVDRKDWPTAQSAIAKLAELDGQTLTASYLRGTVLAGTGHDSEALAQFAAVIGASPQSPIGEHALTALLETYRRQGHLEAAIAYIDGQKIEPSLAATVLGESYAELGRRDEAGVQFDRAINANTDREPPYIDRARLDLINKDRDGAIGVLQRGRVNAPRSLEIPMMLADLLGATGHTQEAVALYDELLQRNPALDRVANNQAELISDAQAGDRTAMEKARRVAERFQGSTNPMFLDTLGWVYFRMDRLNQALPILARAAAAQGALPQMHYHYGAALLKAGSKDMAKDQLEMAVQSKTSYPGIDTARTLLESL